MNLVLISILLGQLTITSYRSVPNQTDDTPFYTSIGEHVHPHGVAVSQDLLKKNGGPLDYGDTLYIEGFGFKVINDCMNKRYTNRIDIWVKTYDEEKKINIKSKKVWIVKSMIKELK